MSTDGSDIGRSLPPAAKQVATSEAAKLISGHALKHSGDEQVAPMATPNLKPDSTDPPHRGRGLSR